MACRIHGLKNCPLPSCAGTNPLCDAHLMDNCHICAANPATSLEDVIANPTSIKPPKLLPSPAISDPKASAFLTAAEAHAQAQQDVATIAENVGALTRNLHAAKTKLAEAKAAVSETKKRLAELLKKGDE